MTSPLLSARLPRLWSQNSSQPSTPRVLPTKDCSGDLSSADQLSVQNAVLARKYLTDITDILESNYFLSPEWKHYSLSKQFSVR